MIIDGLNALISAFSLIFQAIFQAPLYQGLTWGYFLIACSIMAILISFFISRFK